MPIIRIFGASQVVTAQVQSMSLPFLFYVFALSWSINFWIPSIAGGDQVTVINFVTAQLSLCGKK
jgi:hypothetical protein